MSSENGHLYRFREFGLDTEERVLTCRGKPVALTPKALELLCVLVVNHGRIVEKKRLMSEVWADRFVEDSNLTFTIRRLRKALGDDAHRPVFIETIPSRGYRFIAEVLCTAEAELVGRGDAEKIIILPTDPSPAFLPVSAFPHPGVSSNGAVVALADWRHKENRTDAAEQSSSTSVPFESIEQIAAHESNPAKLNGEKTLAPEYRFPLAALALAAMLMGAAGLGYFFYNGKSVAGADGAKSIAVLPLKPINAGMRDEIYEIGIADSLIHRLSSMRGLVVRPLSAMRRYADIEQDALAAGREQQADFVLASNYQLAGGKIRVTTQLFNVGTGQIEETYKSEKDAVDIFAMQDAIAVEIGNLLQKRFAAAAPSNLTARRGTTNEVAYRLYLQGIYLIEKMGYDNAKRSIELFDEALALDQNYAQAWAGKAWAHCYFSHVGGNSPDEQYAVAKPAIERAFALDPNLPEAYAVLGVIKIDYDWNFADGEKQFLRSIEIAPTSDIAHAWYATRLAAREGRIEEAIALIKTAVDLNPNNVIHQIRYGRTLYLARRYDEAITQLQRAGEMDSAHPYVHGVLWRSYYIKGDHARAYESFVRQQQLLKINDETLRSYETSYTKNGWQGVLLRHLEIMTKMSVPANAYYLATLSALAGQPELSFRYLDEAVKKRSGDIPDMVSEPAFDSLRGDPRFDEMVKRANVPQ